MRTSRYLSPCEMKTWRECCSPHGRYESPTRTAWRSEPSPTVKTEASSTRRPSSSTSPSLPTPTESTLNDTRQRCADDFVSSTCGTTEIDEWAGVVLEKLPHQLKNTEKKRLCVECERGQWVNTALKTQGSKFNVKRGHWRLTGDLDETGYLLA